MLLHNLNEIRENLLVTANYPSQSGPANEKLRLQVVNLRGTVSRLPKPFARMVSEIADEFEGEEAGSTKAQMNEALANIAKVCKRVTVGKYPFARGASANAQIGEFAQLFGPSGLLDKYFADYLAPITDISGQKWAWQGGLAARPGSVGRYAEAVPARFRHPQRILPGRRSDAQHPADDRAEHHLQGRRHGAAGGEPGGAADLARRQRAGLLHLARQWRLGHGQHQPLPGAARTRIAHRQGRAVGVDAADRCRQR